MSLRACIRALVAGCPLAIAGAALAQPANDLCANATVISSVPYSSGNVNYGTATNDTGVNPSCDTSGNTDARQGVWWTYTPAASGVINLAQVASPTQDTSTSIWTGTCGALTQVACSDPEASTFTATAGVQYYILISKWSATNATSTSNVAFTLTLPPPVIAQTDTCAAPTVIASLPYAATMPVDTATDDTNINPSCDSTSNTAGAKQGVWFSYTAGPSGAGLLLSETGSQDIVMTAWSGASCAALTQVLCSDAESNIALSVPPSTTYLICISNYFATSYTTGSSITFTVTAPLAACCSNTTGACTLTATTCGTGTTTATGTTCAPDPCLALVGACCSTTAGTCSSALAAGCTSPSTFQGVGTTCTPNPCGGACCTTTGTCSTTTLAGCTGTNTFQGLGTACTPNPCGGACCNTATGTCSSSTAVLCVGANTSFQGLGTVCTPTNPCTGACCNNSTGACSLAVAATCPVGSTFTTLGSVCSPTPCPTGGCCSTISGFCAVTGPAGCTANPGPRTYLGTGVTCSAANCTPPSAPANDACSIPEPAGFDFSGVSSFTVLGQIKTATADGTTGSPTTAPNSSPCSSSTTWTGGAGNSVYYTFTPSISTNFAIGVCYPSNVWDSVVSIHTACPTSQANSLACNDDGACAGGVGLSLINMVPLNAGVTYVIRIAAYSTSTVINNGEFTLQVTGDPVGACCKGDGSCSPLTAASCTTMSGAYQGDGAACATAVCTGACCNNATAACTSTGSGSCAGGTFQGLGVSCSPSPCPGGACCTTDTATCTFTGAAGCSSPNTFQGLGTICSPSPCPGGACCDFTAGTCSFTGPSGCFGGTYQGSGTSCTPNPCAGACCNDLTAACTTTGPTGCATGNTFQGLGTVCSPTPCPSGACCNSTTGACTVAGSAPGCGADTFQGVGTVCLPNSCPQPPPPANDTCAGAIALTLGTAYTGDTTWAQSTNDGPASTCTTSGHYKGVWFQFTTGAAAGAVYQVSSCGTSYDTVVTAYGDVVCQSDDVTPSGTQVGCNDDNGPACTGSAASVNLSGLSPSTTYHVRLCAYSSSSAGGAYSMLVSEMAPIGICCNTASGACTALLSGSCASGTTLGTGTTCDGGTPSSFCGVVAACCNDASGACTLIYGGSCGTGTHTASGLVCDASTCPATGSCCNSVTGACTLTYNASCTSPLSFNAATSCTPSPCTSGPHICENLDGSGSLPTGWTTTSTGTGLPWAIAVDQSNSASNSVFTDDIAGVSSQYLVMPAVTAGGTLTLDFWSYYGTESTFDGWVVEYSTDGGTTWTDIGSAGWALNGYTATISTNFSSPILGQQAFTGSHLTWTEHIGAVPATAGQSVIVRFHMASDTTVGSTGVWLDDICIGGIQVVIPGVCCRGSTCSSAFATAADCGAATTTTSTGGPGWAFVTSASPCNAGVNADGTYSGSLTSVISPCCFANYNHNAGLEVQDIFDFLNDWFAGRAIAIPGGDGTSHTGLAVQNIFNFLNAWFAGGCH